MWAYGLMIYTVDLMGLASCGLCHKFSYNGRSYPFVQIIAVLLRYDLVQPRLSMVNVYIGGLKKSDWLIMVNW